MNYVKDPINTSSCSNITVKAVTFNGITKPEQLFGTLEHLPWSMWLDSCSDEHIDSQFDIIVFHPQITFTTYGVQTEVTSALDEFNFTSKDDPLTLINETQKKVFNGVNLPKTHLPFIGGALGYWSYDLSHRFEQLPTTAIKDINLADMSVGIYTHAIIYDHQTNEFFLICDEPKRRSIEQQLVSLIKQHQTQHEAFTLKSAWQANMSQSEYIDKFNQVQDYLLSGDCYQINLAQRFSADYSGNEFTAYKTLRSTNKAPFSAFLRFADNAILSISPERFLKLANNTVQTKPIKGTMPRAEDEQQDKLNATLLRHSEKDRAENLMIVDLLRNDISKVCLPGTVNVPKIFDIESFPAVHHLVSTVEGELENKYNATDLLRASFPGGSITGAPKIRAMEIIDELEPHKRSLYCGSIGYISACGNMDTSITIRTLICEKGKIHCWAGGGLVADSQATSEYQETFDKVAKILPILA